MGGTTKVVLLRRITPHYNPLFPRFMFWTASRASPYATEGRPSRSFPSCAVFYAHDEPRSFLLVAGKGVGFRPLLFRKGLGLSVVFQNGINREKKRSAFAEELRVALRLFILWPKSNVSPDWK
jgi:hypothetical protein